MPVTDRNLLHKALTFPEEPPTLVYVTLCRAVVCIFPLTSSHQGAVKEMSFYT